MLELPELPVEYVPAILTEDELPDKVILPSPIVTIILSSFVSLEYLPPAMLSVEVELKPLIISLIISDKAG